MIIEYINKKEYHARKHLFRWYNNNESKNNLPHYK